MPHIVCFHILNDYSGSPKVLKNILSGLLKRGVRVHLVTSRGGVLDELKTEKGIQFSQYNFTFSENQLVYLFKFLCIQTYLFFFSIRYLFIKNTVFYINTIMPVGAALAGRIMCKKVVYHYHENAFKSTFYRLLAKIMQLLATEIICVSGYQRSFLSHTQNATVIPNALPDEFCNQFSPNAEKSFNQKRVLMLSSLKKYKGTVEFIELAAHLPQYCFELVINDTDENIQLFLAENIITKTENLKIYARQDNVVPFYQRATLVVNLSNKNLFIETFGMTVLEAMTAGLPVIVPTVGGVAELVEDGVNGYKIDVRDLGKIEGQIQIILSNYNLYQTLSQRALKTAKGYDNNFLVDKVLQVIGT
jgi:glycosyltransferase involved in cell wall biosynthesis